MTRNPRALRILAAIAALAVTAGLILSNRDAGDGETAGFRVGLQDDRLSIVGQDIPARMGLVADSDARVVRVDLRWDMVAPRRPANPADPGDPAYDWSHYDAVVDAADARSVDVLFAVWGTPGWATDMDSDYGSTFPAHALAPTDPDDYGLFGEALARRYAPRGVNLWEAWNEPNIPLFLRPQFRRVGNRWVSVAPRTYARLLRAFYTGVKAADPDAVVAGGVTAPAGNRCPSSCPDDPDDRTYPGDFFRALDAEGLRPPMDVVSHHPYPLRIPRDPDAVRTFAGAAYIDLYNLDVLTDILDAGYLADRPLWLTEFGVSTRRVTQYPLFTDEDTQARLLTDAVARARAVPGVEMFIWYLLQDHAEWASGLMREDGTDKPSRAAFRTAAGDG